MDEVTEQKYLQNSTICPHCESTDLCGDSFEPFGPEQVTQDISCNNCHEEWKDLYTLTGILRE